jgi:hypothetical protein
LLDLIDIFRNAEDVEATTDEDLTSLQSHYIGSLVENYKSIPVADNGTAHILKGHPQVLTKVLASCIEEESHYIGSLVVETRASRSLTTERLTF